MGKLQPLTTSSDQSFCSEKLKQILAGRGMGAGALNIWFLTDNVTELSAHRVLHRWTVTAGFSRVAEDQLHCWWRSIQNRWVQNRRTESTESEKASRDVVLPAAYIHRPNIFPQMSAQNKNKLSYRRESAHLTSLHPIVQKAFRYVEPFRHWSRVWQTDGQMSIARARSNRVRCALKTRVQHQQQMTDLIM